MFTDAFTAETMLQPDIQHIILKETRNSSKPNNFNFHKVGVACEHGLHMCFIFFSTVSAEFVLYFFSTVSAELFLYVSNHDVSYCDSTEDEFISKKVSG